MAFSPEALKVLKTTTEGTSIINKAASEFFSITDFQQKNQFEMLLLPEEWINLRGDTGFETAKRIVKMAVDTVVSQFLVQNIDFPHMGLEFSRYDNLQAVQDIMYPDECTMSFIETDTGLVRQFLSNWMSLQFSRDSLLGGYNIADNQWTARKKAIIMPLSKMGLPQTSWLEIRGMRLKNPDNISLDQQASDPMIINCTFAIDDAYINTLI